MGHEYTDRELINTLVDSTMAAAHPNPLPALHRYFQDQRRAAWEAGYEAATGKLPHPDITKP